MTADPLEIVPCPPVLVGEAFAMALSELAPDLRRELVAPILERAGDGRVENLLVALDGEKLVGAAWGQRHPGNTAVLWSPHVADGANDIVERALIGAVVKSFDAADVRMSQILLPERESAVVPRIEAAGFQFLAELWYLNWEVQPNLADDAKDSPLAFESYDEPQCARLASVIERTYIGTRDCPAMNGRRTMDEVLAGYASTGTFRPGNWWFARSENQDVGVLLLAEHAAEHWELMYMGLVPEVRGRGWGREIVRHAQRQAARVGVERIVLAVDGLNLPALTMYRDAGFMAWDRRTVFVRFAPNPSSGTAQNS